MFEGKPANVGVQVSGMTAGYTYADLYGKTELPMNAIIMSGIGEARFFEVLAERLRTYGHRR
jgi:purine nucleosidase